MARDAGATLRNIAVLGAGAMGCYFAANMAEGGFDVTLVDIDAQRLAQINALGIHIIDHLGERVVQVKAVSAATLQGRPDLVVVFTKSLHTRAAVESIAGKIGRDTWLLTLQNGLGNAEQIAKAAPAERVLHGVTDVPADFRPPTTVESHGEGKIAFYDYLNRGPAVLNELERLFQRSNLAASVDPEVDRALWEKVAFNAAMNAPTAILRKPVGALNTPSGLALIGAALAEVEQVAASLGVSIDHQRVWGRIKFALREHAGHLSSMLQDVNAGRATEIDAINGAIVAAGQQTSVETPVNRTLVQLVKSLEPLA